jgi:hypothetical protein
MQLGHLSGVGRARSEAMLPSAEGQRAESIGQCTRLAGSATQVSVTVGMSRVDPISWNRQCDALARCAMLPLHRHADQTCAALRKSMHHHNHHHISFAHHDARLSHSRSRSHSHSLCRNAFQSQPAQRARCSARSGNSDGQVTPDSSAHRPLTVRLRSQ